MNKIKILALTETPLNATGLGVYAEQILSRLSSQPNFEVGALACFGFNGDPRLKDLPYKVWQAFLNGDEPEHFQQIYRNNKDALIGAAHFEKICEEFRPDVVISWRDYEHDYFVNNSPYRKFFKYVNMPTVDSENRPNVELDFFLRCDKLLNYSAFGREVLLKQCPKLENKLCGLAPPAADYNIFSPVLDKCNHKIEHGFGPYDTIIGTCNRNQPRKLFPELINSFANLVQKFPTKNLKLYLHTTYPDAAWNIPRLLLMAGIASKTYLSYKCSVCDFWCPSNYNGYEVSPCPKCGNNSFKLITTEDGLSRSQLSDVYNLLDIYVQPNSNEGFGMSMLEAASCGIPVVGTDYSAMSDVLNAVNGTKIPAHKYLEQNMERILSKIEAIELSSVLENLLLKPSPLRQALGFSSSILARLNFDYDESAQTWIDTINSLDIDRKEWVGEIKRLPPAAEIAFLPDNQFVDICFNGLSSASKWNKAMILKDLYAGKINKHQIYNMANDSTIIHNYWISALSDKNGVY